MLCDIFGFVLKMTQTLSFYRTIKPAASFAEWEKDAAFSRIARDLVGKQSINFRLTPLYWVEVQTLFIERINNMMN